MKSRGSMMMSVTAAIGVALLVWTVASVGLTQLMSQLHLLGVILPFALALAALRFVLQAVGWRVVMPAERKPALLEATAAVIAGEAAGYLAWGPISREPVKALMLSPRTPQRMSLAAAVAERLAYTGAATGLVIAGLVILAVRTHHVAWMGAGATIAVLGTGCWVLGAGSWCWVPGSRTKNQEPGTGTQHPAPSTQNRVLALVSLAILQELTNVFESYVVLAWLGATPTIEAVIAFEGLSRLANSAGQFIPGKIGVLELVGAGLANFLQLGSVHGLTLTLARRLRSLIWSGVGVAVMTVSAARQGSDAMTTLVTGSDP